MNCIWQDIPDSADERGWRRVVCVRCHRALVPTPHPHERIHAACKALPFAHEWGHWLTILLGVFGISKAGVEWLRHRLGLLGGCGCDKRAEKLNSWGAWLFRSRKDSP